MRLHRPPKLGPKAREITAQNNHKEPKMPLIYILFGVYQDGFVGLKGSQDKLFWRGPSMDLSSGTVPPRRALGEQAGQGGFLGPGSI